ncbi:hypothetical protein ES703_80404 [subsurface metagenome]
MLAEDSLDIAAIPFQPRKVEENGSGQFQFLAKQANLGDESAVFFKRAMG